MSGRIARTAGFEALKSNMKVLIEKLAALRADDLWAAQAAE